MQGVLRAVISRTASISVGRVESHAPASVRYFTRSLAIPVGSKMGKLKILDTTLALPPVFDIWVGGLHLGCRRFT